MYMPPLAVSTCRHRKAKGHVFASHDGGGSWDDITFNLPDAPLSSVVVDARDQYAGVYVGGALGVWVLQKDSQQWLPYGNGMPFTRRPAVN